MEAACEQGSVRVSVFGKTDLGRTREHNEDTFLVADLSTGNASLQPEVRDHEVGPRGSLFMVADGMGGAAAGELASAMAADVIYRHMATAWAERRRRPRPQRFAYRMKEAVELANAQIYAYAREHPEVRGMGTTATAAGVFGDDLYLAQIGDSRAYLVRGGEAIQLTKDQSLMQRLVDAGELTEEEAEQSERRNIILQALGPEPQVKVDLTHQPLRRGDMLVLCSDGLSGQVRREEIAELARRHAGPACALLRADRPGERAAAGPDNITVVAARFEGEGLPEPDGRGRRGLPGVSPAGSGGAQAERALRPRRRRRPLPQSPCRLCRQPSSGRPRRLGSHPLPGLRSGSRCSPPCMFLAATAVSRPLAARVGSAGSRALAFASGFPFGLVNETLPVYLRTHGAGLVDIGRLAASRSLEPQVPLVAAGGPARQPPAVDRRLPRGVGGYSRWCWRPYDPARLGPAFWFIADRDRDALGDPGHRHRRVYHRVTTTRELGVANSVRIASYRVAMFMAGGLLIWLAGRADWGVSFTSGAAALALLTVAALLIPAPEGTGARPHAIWEPLRALVARRDIWAVVVFALLFKLDIAALEPMTRPFWVDRGFSLTEIGAVLTTGRLVATLAGAALGGVLTSW